MGDKVLFRNKGRGYNKDDVNEYIAAENKRFADTEAEYKRQIQEKERIVSGFSNELFQCKNENNALNNSVAEKDKEIETFKAKVEEADKTIESLRARVSELENEKAKMEAEIAEISKNPKIVYRDAPTESHDESRYTTAPDVKETTFRTKAVDNEPAAVDFDDYSDYDRFEHDYSESKIYTDDVYKKAEAYDRICDQIDEIIDYAKSEADNIINTALEASRKIRSSRSEVNSMKREISGRSSGIIGEIKKSVVKKH